MEYISLGTAGLTALLGYVVVFFGIFLLMIVIEVMGSIMKGNSAKAAAAGSAKVAASSPVDLGEIHAPDGADPLEVAIMAAIVADMERGY